MRLCSPIPSSIYLPSCQLLPKSNQTLFLHRQILGLISSQAFLNSSFFPSSNPSMASAAGMIGSCGASSSSLAGKGMSRGSRQRRSSEQSTYRTPGIRCAYGSSTLSSSRSGGSLVDQYRTLRIQHGASESEVKKAFRQLALQYHPDVCKGNNCVVQFHQINEAYDMVMNSLRSSDEDDSDNASTSPRWTVEDDDQMRGMYDSTWDLWEEWMGFEGAGGWDYTSHINPYI